MLSCRASKIWSIDFGVSRAAQVRALIEEGEKLAQVLQMEKAVIPSTFVFVGHGFEYHVGAGWNDHHALKYYPNAFPEGTDLKDAVPLVYRTSFRSTNGLTDRDAGKGKETKEEESELKMDYGEDSQVDKWELGSQIAVIEDD